MDDTEDDARYPPNPYPSNSRRPFPSSNRSKIPSRNPSSAAPVGRGYPSYEDEDDEEEPDDIDRAVDEEEDEDDEEDEGSGDSSSESRGKRRRLDKLALGFEFAPRAAAAAAAAAASPSVSKPPPPPGSSSRVSPADWSEDSTFVLLDAWGDLYVQNGRKSLRSDEWSEVAKKVAQSSRTVRSDAQCRNRLDTLKKKYKKEKARMETTMDSSSSKWVYFTKMDSLMSTLSPPRQQQQTPRLPCGVDAGEYVFSSANCQDEMRDSPRDSAFDEDEEDDDEDESDGLPPETGKGSGSTGSASFRMLADSIQKFGEIYERMEKCKRQQMAELERMRKDFQRDLEAQKRQILERAQAEIEKLRQGDEEGEDEEEEEEEDEDEENDNDEDDNNDDQEET